MIDFPKVVLNEVDEETCQRFHEALGRMVDGEASEADMTLLVTSSAIIIHSPWYSPVSDPVLLTVEI